MGIPDEVYFGENINGESIHYGEARKISNEQHKLIILKKRLDVLLIKQIGELSRQGNNSSYIIWSPFPLCVLTFLGIETLGRIIGDIEKIKANNEFEQSKIIVTPIYGLLDKKLLHKPTKPFITSFKSIHGNVDKKLLSRYSDVIHKYQRNTFNHGYQARGVFLDHAIHTFWIIEEKKGYVTINPYLFWKRFNEVYEDIFQKILSNNEKTWRLNSLKYFEKLIS